MTNSYARPVDVATRQTFEFISANLPARARVLEIGCGTGHVARALMDAGHSVVAIDSDADVVEAARRMGVEARLAGWPDCQVDPADAVVFSRSLHHLHGLDAALVAARRALKPSGRLLVEDFAFDAVTPDTVEWLQGAVRPGRDRGLLRDVEGEFITGVLEADDALAAWRADHDHDLHSFETIREAAGAVFDVHEASSTAYLYRYLIPVAAESAGAARWVAAILEEELQRGRRGEIALLGRRLVARGK